MNNNNLIPNSRRTREKLQEMGRKGGIKSGETRRRKRDIKKAFLMMLELTEFEPEPHVKPEGTTEKRKNRKT